MKPGYGLVAGFAATVVLSAIMLKKSMMGMMPQVNAVQMLTKLGSMYLDLPLFPWIGWLLHILIGTVAWGLIFAATIRIWPGSSYWMKGVMFSTVAWLLMMVIPMPMVGAGFFGLLLGIGTPIATLVLHIIYGAVLGGVYGALVGGTDRQVGRPASH